MVTLPRAQGTHVKVGSKVIYPKYIDFNVQKLFCICFAHESILFKSKVGYFTKIAEIFSTYCPKTIKFKILLSFF